MDRGTQVFWALIIALLGASTYFGFGVQEQMRSMQTPEASLETGALVHLDRVIDGDTVVVKTNAGDSVVVRILGIKSFESSPPKAASARFGAQAVDALRQLGGSGPIRVLLASPAKDRHGRTLATLVVGGEDLGLSLVKRGLSLVYTPYPFPAMSLYLEAQAAARFDKRGLWGDAGVAERAEALSREWQGQAE